MSTQATIRNLGIPGSSQVTVRIEVSANVNISAFTARQKANHFLIMQAGDQLCAEQPELVVGPTLYWRVPVQYTPSRRGPLGIVGHLLIDADTGEITIADGQTSEDLMARAEAYYERTTL